MQRYYFDVRGTAKLRPFQSALHLSDKRREVDSDQTIVQSRGNIRVMRIRPRPVSLSCQHFCLCCSTSNEFFYIFSRTTHIDDIPTKAATGNNHSESFAAGFKGSLFYVNL